MNARTLIGLALLLLECAVLAGAGGRVLHVAIPFITALVVSLSGRRVRLTTERYVIVLALGAVVALLWWLLMPPRLNRGLHTLGGGETLFYTAALWCIWHQTLQLIVTLRQRFREITGPFPSFPCSAALVIAVAGHFTSWAGKHAHYTAVIAAFAVLAVIYYMARGDRWMFSRYTAAMKAASAALLAVILTGGVLTAASVRNNEERINEWLNSLTIAPPPETALGFSREGKLTNMTTRRSAEDQSPALFVTADRVPGYLRGLAFEHYRDARWILPNPDRWLVAGEASPAYPPPSGGQRNFFQLGEEGTGQSFQRMDVFTATTLLDTVFMPSQATGLFVDTQSIAIDSAGVFREANPERRPGYTAVQPLNAPIRPLTADERTRYTAVPDSLDPRIRDLAAALTADAHTPRDKASAVESYFIGHYDYQLGIQVPPGEEPLNYFLLEKPAAHCEFFASGAAILLRISGVPARYVTGFVAVERNSTGDFYVARNKDAHAWVEAWDPESGWFIVEATPPSGVPSPRNASLLARFRDSATLAWSRFRDGFDATRFDSFWGALSALAGAAFESVYGKVAIGAGLAMAGVYLARRRLRRPGAAKVSPELLRLLPLLARADALALAAGLTRAHNETIGNFSRRVAAAESDRSLQELANWYQQYERVRYRDLANASAHAYLESALPVPR